MAEGNLSIGEVLVGCDHVTVELRGEVVVGVLSDIVPFGLGCLGAHLEFVLLHALGEFERGVVGEDVGVDAEAWNWVVDLVTTILLLMLVLVATS